MRLRGSHAIEFGERRRDVVLLFSDHAYGALLLGESGDREYEEQGRGQTQGCGVRAGKSYCPGAGHMPNEGAAPRTKCAENQANFMSLPRASQDGEVTIRSSISGFRQNNGSQPERIARQIPPWDLRKTEYFRGSGRWLQLFAQDCHLRLSSAPIACSISCSWRSLPGLPYQPYAGARSRVCPTAVCPWRGRVPI